MGVFKAAGAALAMSVLMVGAADAQVEQAQFDASAFSLGTLTPGSGATSRQLWRGADKQAIESLLGTVPTVYQDPLHLELLRRVTLSPGEGPSNADNTLAGEKFITAARAGFYRDAQSLAELVPGLRSEPSLAKVVAYAELLDGQTDAACARGAGLRDGRTDPFWVRLRHFCYVRAGETSAAELTLDLMRRQDWLTDDDIDRAAAYGAGNMTADFVPATPVEFAMRREAGLSLTASELGAANPMIVAAAARDSQQRPEVREVALIKSLAYRTIDAQEAVSLLNDLPTSQLANDLIAVSTQTPGTLEMAEALGAALGRAEDNWSAFTARSILMARFLAQSEPVANYAPNAADIALAGMVTGQSAVVEKWILALAGDGSDQMASVRAGQLVELYSILDPGAARRIGSYIGLVFEPMPVSPLMASRQDDDIGLPTYVSIGLDAAQAGSEGPAALVYLTGLNVATTDETAPVHQTVMGWARQHANLGWLDRQATFRQAAMNFMTAGGPQSASESNQGFPVPRVKPNAN